MGRGNGQIVRGNVINEEFQGGAASEVEEYPDDGGFRGELEFNKYPILH